MINNTNLDDIIKLIKKSSNIVITTHSNPDGDAIGSSVGVHNFLADNQINSEIVLFNAPPSNLSFLMNDSIFIYEDDNKVAEKFISADLIIILDFNDPRRVKDLDQPLLDAKAKKIVIDHHIDPKEFADHYFVDTEIGSTGELIWALISAFKGKITKETAEALYVAIMTDHGNFKYERTGEDTFKIASQLCKYGVEPHKVYDRIYNNNSIERVKLYAQVTSNIEFYLDGLFAVLVVRENDIKKFNANEEDTEGFASMPLSIKGVEIGLLMIETKERDEIRCSFRSKGKYHIRNVANKFGGGGHNYAAGARIKDFSFDKAKSLIVNEVAEYVKSRL